MRSQPMPLQQRQIALILPAPNHRITPRNHHQIDLLIFWHFEQGCGLKAGVYSLDLRKLATIFHHLLHSLVAI